MTKITEEMVRSYFPQLSEIKNQEYAKKAAEIWVEAFENSPCSWGGTGEAYGKCYSECAYDCAKYRCKEYGFMVVFYCIYCAGLMDYMAEIKE